MLDNLFACIFTAPVLGILGLSVATSIYFYIARQPNGTPRMVNIEHQIHKGAMAFLKKICLSMKFLITYQCNTIIVILWTM